MAKLTPISRPDANSGIATCRADPGHFIIGHGNWVACCTEDADLKPTCIVCDSDENCSRYEEFAATSVVGGAPAVMTLMALSSGLQLARSEGAASRPVDPMANLIQSFPSER